MNSKGRLYIEQSSHKFKQACQQIKLVNDSFDVPTFKHNTYIFQETAMNSALLLKRFDVHPDEVSDFGSLIIAYLRNDWVLKNDYIKPHHDTDLIALQLEMINKIKSSAKPGYEITDANCNADDILTNDYVDILINENHDCEIIGFIVGSGTKGDGEYQDYTLPEYFPDGELCKEGVY